MTEHESFLLRWSRRKRAVVAAPTAADPDAVADGEAVSAPLADSPALPLPDGSQPCFDPASLPSIESITADTDIRAFLAPEVPGELTRAALRRVWATDPAIRDFVGLAENQWDFNAPNGVPGFGPFQVTEEMKRRIIDALSGEPSDESEATSLTAAQPSQPALETIASVDGAIGGHAEPELPTRDSQHDGEQDSSTDGRQPAEVVMVRHSNPVDIAPARQRHPEKHVSIVVGPSSHGRALPE